MIEKCKGCSHRRGIGFGSTSPACHYSLDTGKIRNCTPDDCDKLTHGVVRSVDSWNATAEGEWNKRAFERGLQNVAPMQKMSQENM